MKQFSILITTKNRLEDLKFTLQKINHMVENENVECIICDDGSIDKTSEFIVGNYPKIQLINNPKSKGLIYSRNRLLNLTSADYAISLDDDAHFITENPLKIIEQHFVNNQNCGVIACRIFWGKELPKNIESNEEVERIQGFVGCAHVWNLKAWRRISNYPEWFEFYGEEEFASFKLFKKRWEIHYVPQLFVQHRVVVKERKKERDYYWRLRRSLRSGWYLYLLFYPLKKVPKKFFYSLWMQFKLKVFKGDLKAGIAILLAILDLLINLPRICIKRSTLTSKEFTDYKKLTNPKIYWKPE